MGDREIERERRREKLNLISRVKLRYMGSTGQKERKKRRREIEREKGRRGR